MPELTREVSSFKFDGSDVIVFVAESGSTGKKTLHQVNEMIVVLIELAPSFHFPIIGSVI